MSTEAFNDQVGFSDEIQLPREGSHQGIIMELYHWGVSQYMNQKPKDRYVYIYWLFDDLRTDGDKKGFPLEVWEFFNPTLGAPKGNPSTFRKRIEKIHGFAVTQDHVKNKDKRTGMASLVQKPVELVLEYKHKDGKITPKVTSVFALDPSKVAPNFQGLLKAELAARPDEGGKGGGVYILHDKYIPYIMREKKTGDTSFDPSQFASDEDHEEASAPDGQPAVENATLDVPNF